jgi:uncharacterized protein (DUF169 family)
MPDIKTCHQASEELERRLRLKTLPVAFKLLTKESDIPKEALRPRKDMGYHLAACQGLQLSRRDGATVAMLKEDHWCAEAVIGYGLGEAPEYFMQGHNRYPDDVDNLEAGRHYAEEYPKLPLNKYTGTVSAPLRATTFEPDIIIIYCDSTQLSLLMLAREYKDGYNLKTALSSHAACVYSVVPPMLNDDFQVSIPCRGDHYHAMAGDEELIFSLPGSKLDMLLSGLRYVEKIGSELPKGYSFRPEYPLKEPYAKIGKMMGFIE